MSLVIRRHQLKIFAAAAEEKFLRRLFDHARRVFAEELADTSDEILRTRIEDAVEAARGQEFTLELSVCRFVDLTFLFGPKFYKNSRLRWAQQILQDETLPPWLKAEQLWDQAGEEIARAEEEQKLRNQRSH